MEELSKKFLISLNLPLLIKTVLLFYVYNKRQLLNTKVFRFKLQKLFNISFVKFPFKKVKTRGIFSAFLEIKVHCYYLYLTCLSASVTVWFLGINSHYIIFQLICILGHSLTESLKKATSSVTK